MKTETDKYKKVVEMLRSSTPRLDSTHDIEEAVLKQVALKHKTGITTEEIIDFLFGWAYIGWVRRSLITASLILVMIFIYQHGLLIREINYLSTRADNSTETRKWAYNEAVDRELMTMRLKGERIFSENITVSKEKMDSLLESVNDLQEKYIKLLYLIEKDPELRKIIEEKISDADTKKTKI